MTSIMYLVFAHCVLDYPLQSTFLATMKGKYNFLLFVHCVIWGLGHAIVLQYLGIYAPWKAVWLVAGHYLIDYIKCHYTKEGVDPLGIPLWLDQAAHMIQLMAVL